MENRWKAMSEQKSKASASHRVDAQGHGHLLRPGEEQQREPAGRRLVDQFYARLERRAAASAGTAPRPLIQLLAKD
jgi:hypothetical protein